MLRHEVYIEYTILKTKDMSSRLRRINMISSAESMGNYLLTRKMAAIVGSKNLSDAGGWNGQHDLFRDQRPPDLVVKPSSTNEIRRIVRLADRKGFALVPRSSRKPYSRITVPRQKWMLIDLSGMNRILNVDERNWAARIEPGVSWGQLQEELHRHGLRASMPLLPHPGKSVLTDLLEREPVLIPKFEYAEPVLTLEAVLPDGHLLRTGSASGPSGLDKTKSSLVGQPGPGNMDFYRLFQGAQGSHGIVTWINLKVEQLPKVQKLYFIPCRTIKELASPLYQIQRRMFGYECLALNQRELSDIIAANADGRQPGLEKRLPPWAIIVCLGGGLRHPEKKLAYEEKALQEITRSLGLKATEKLKILDGSFLEKLQQPWKERNCFRHRLGGRDLSLFFITNLNKAADCAMVFTGLVEKYGFTADDVGIYIQPLEYGRACHVEFSIVCGPDSHEETFRMKDLAKESVKLTAGQGGFFSRLYPPWGEWVAREYDSQKEPVDKLKKVFDPRNIMNPGVRYGTY